jgi:2',3'-cyclic-nucleotide 2'-phosphodiesterase
MRLLFVGDIVGKPGRRIVAEKLNTVVYQHHIDLVIINCENAAAGFGVTPAIADELFDLGAHVLTSGNHIWDKKVILDYLAASPRLLRPANYPAPAPGSGLYIGDSAGGTRFAVINLQGRTYLPSIDCPFRAADRLLQSIPADVKVRVVDFHAEVTSEKVAFGWYLDGRVSAVIGTHTHIPTADERVLPGGTAYLTDVGMTGPYDSVIGMDKQASLDRFLSGVPVRFEPAMGDARLSSVVIDVDEATGRARSIKRLVVRGDEDPSPK